MPGFQSLCTITANLSNLKGALKKQIGPNGKAFWKVDFEIELKFGTNELKANIKWKEKSIFGPVSFFSSLPLFFARKLV